MTERIEHIADGVTLYLGDCRDLMFNLTGDVILTSPPYGQQRDYGRKVDDWRGLVSGALMNCLDTGQTQILVNLGLIHRDGEVVPYWSNFIEDMRASGWRWFGWYMWDQMSGMAGDWNGRLAPSFELIFHFNRTARQVNKTKPTLGGRQHGPGLKSVGGEAGGKTHDGKPVQPFKIPDNVIRTPREQSGGYEAQHPARFPVALPRELIAAYSDPGETIVDPFMGSGTTGVAAVKMGRQFIGIEIAPQYFDIACKRISDALKQPDMFIERPKPAVQLGLLDAAE